MPNNPQKSPSFRLSRQGFQPLNTNSNETGDNMGNPENIPLQTVVSHTPSHSPAAHEEHTEKSGLFHRHAGRRKVQKIDSKSGAPRPGDDGDPEKPAVNRMGKFYTKILNFSIVTRYMIYVAPLAIILAIPIILSETVLNQKDSKTGSPKHTIGGADEKLFWIWIEIVWLSLWACKVVAHFLPNIFEFLIGVVSPGVRKYALLLRAIEKPLSIVFWMIVTQVTFPTLVKTPRSWRDTMISVLRAALISSCIVLGERILIQLISISYHRKQFDAKIKDSKRNIYLLGQLYDASRQLFPAYCNEFAEEDYIIQDSLQLTLGSKKTTFGTRGRSNSGTPMRLLQDVGRFGDKVTSVFGTVAQEITGKKILDPNSAHSIVLEALDKNRSAEALARRIWMSFVAEGKDSLYQEDLMEVLGAGRQHEAEECFSALDRDGNGDISLEEMILTVTEYGRERKSIASSMHDVDQAINALDGLLFTIVFIVCIFVFIAFLSPSFVGTLTTSATALLSLSFVFAATCQEVLGSCIFLFVKHPYDIGDRVDLATDQLTVEHISLLYTVFKRVQNGKMVQIPNIVLNNLWVENITRSKAMREQVSIFVNFDTTFEDVNVLKQEMQAFVRDPANSRDFHSDMELEVVSIAEMNKLELRCEIRHKSNWSNEALRASRRSKFMCALVLALRKIPIYGPGGGDAALGDAGKPSWSVAISPADAIAARDKYNQDKDAKRLYPTAKPNPREEDNSKSSSTDYLGVGNTEGQAIHQINNRKPGADPVRDDTWNNRDDVSTLGRPSTDARPDLDEVRGLLHKESNRGKRKQGPTLDQPRQGMPPLPIPVVPSPHTGTSGQNYAQPPQQRTQPASPSSVSTGHVEEFEYQRMQQMQPSQPMPPPPRSQSRPVGSQPPEGNAFAYSMQRPVQAPRLPQSPNTGSNNPYRSPSPHDQHPYKP
ncbi:serine/threonine protein kinase-like protein [Lindgomyces ingoldianus]|uniref:Serine/threonine protein kinase-like protein n=1 Tax=Lindgomyces ingoldianus TaxID=673940 RepID=A0ACB6R3P3_9PLEO|nr:serine/threonine protein kinase-like protein [Lindgomyces ingoldianus]KAF2473395.1 serine/threonine protein kinase-like protein [Lindgomyces ingoldianus]